jgi:6-phosphogluconolactonase
VIEVQPLLDELARAHAQSGGVTTTATMTFVLFVDDPEVASWARERTRAIADKHPSRVIIFDATQRPGQHNVDTSHARGEWIEVGAGQSRGEELAGALGSLELPEAPLVLAWIAANLSRDPRFPVMAQHADTVICGTSAINPDTSQLRDLIAYTEGCPECEIRDVAYLRLGPWQELVAELFDEPQFANEIGNIRSVEVTCGSDAEMYYLLGWLASRLGWSPAAPNQFSNVSGNLVRFDLARRGEPRRLQRVALATQNLSFVAETVANDPSVARLSITGSDRPHERFAPVRSLDIASLVERAILTQHRDEMFRESLSMAKHILERQSPTPLRNIGELRVFDTPDDVARGLADLFADKANEAFMRKGRFTVSLAGGKTPEAAYKLLANSPYREAIPWKAVHAFFGDERCVPPDDDQSNYKTAYEAFIGPVGVPPENVHRMRGEDDPPAAAMAYRKELVAALGEQPHFDLVMLGMGDDGHTASLFPGEDPLVDDASLVRAVYSEPRRQWRLTLTPQVLNAGDTVVFTVEGSAKAPALFAVREGPYDPRRYPAQIVAPKTNRLIWLADRAAASLLSS